MADIISKENFQSMPPENQMLTLYELQTCTYQAVKALSEHCPEQKDECVKRFESLEKGKKWDKVWSVAGGFIGGFAAVIGKATFWK